MKRWAKAASGFFGILSGVKAIDSALKGDRPEASRQLAKARRFLGPAPGVASGEPMGVEHFDVKNIEERVQILIELTQEGREHPEIHRFVGQALNRRKGNRWAIPEGDYEAEVVAIFKAIRANVRYVHDPMHADWFQHSVRTLELGKADCDDYSVLLASCLQAAGYPAKFRVIQTKDSPDWNHIYNLVGIPPMNPRWHALDASVNREPGWEVPRKQIRRKKDFEIP